MRTFSMHFLCAQKENKNTKRIYLTQKKEKVKFKVEKK